MSIVRLENIEYSLPNKNDSRKKTILKDVSLQVHPGEFHVITGPSGSGKTTLLQLIATFLHQTNGSRKIFDFSLSSNEPQKRYYQVRSRIGYLFQLPYLPSTLPVKQFIIDQGAVMGLGLASAERMANDLLEELAIDQLAKQPPRKLSGGEKQRVALASILIKQVDLLLLDEPAGSLDNETKRQLWKLIKRLQEERELTIIVVTHDKSVKKIAKHTHNLDYGILKK
jgi:ABC-type lipoprotein export system ATPase subunit